MAKFTIETPRRFRRGGSSDNCSVIPLQLTKKATTITLCEEDISIFEGEAIQKVLELTRIHVLGGEGFPQANLILAS